MLTSLALTMPRTSSLWLTEGERETFMMTSLALTMPRTNSLWLTEGKINIRANIPNFDYAENKFVMADGR